MQVSLPAPDAIINDPVGGEIPAWQCPHCQQNKPLEDFGWRKRDDIYPGQNIWHKQSWCRDCRALPAQP